MQKRRETVEEIADRVEAEAMQENNATAAAKPDPIADPTIDYLLTTTQVGKILGCNKNFVKDLISAKLLVSLKFGRRHKIRKKSLNTFLEKFDGQNLVELVNSKKIARHTAS